MGYPRCALGLALAVASFIATTPPAAEANAVASFTYASSSSPPLTRDVVTFASTSTTDGVITALFWDFGDGTFGDQPSVEHQYPRPGDYQVRLEVWDNLGSSDRASETIHIENREPAASFVYSPSSPGTGERITFTSTSTDPDGQIVEERWDLDGDGAFDDASGETAARTFSRPGNQIVGLRVTDNHGGSTATQQVIPVGNRPPSASFAHSPDAPLAGDTVTVYSTSTDPDGPIVEQTWDLDGDGAYDDASGATATQSFAVAGTYTVGLRVVDDDGVAATASKRLDVLPRPGPATASGPGTSFGTQARTLRLLNPFPVIRIIGTVTRRGVRLRRLLVDAPSGARVSVRCRGRRCPFRKRTSFATTRSPSLGATAARIIRFRRLERRLLRAGVRIKVMVTKPDAIGKFTFFRIRRGRSPVRVDRCLVPGLSKPVRCSAT
jgi:PKD repeat protein